MKLSDFILPILAVVLLTACSNDVPDIPDSNGNVVTFLAKLPVEMNTRYFGDASKINELEYAVYDENEEFLFSSRNDGMPKPHASGDGYTLTLNLPVGKTFSIVFWTRSEGADKVYSFDIENARLKVDYTNLAANDDRYDIFFTSLRGFEINGPITQQTTLYRPMAQINIGTDDIVKAAFANQPLSDTDIIVSGVYDTLNLLTGEASASAGNTLTAEFTAVKPVNDKSENIIKYPQGEQYEYLAMVYVLTGSVIENDDVNTAQSELAKITLNFNSNGESINKIVIGSIPIQRNYRTNIYGSLLTSLSDWKITLAPDSSTEDYKILPWDGVIIDTPHIDE